MADPVQHPSLLELLNQQVRQSMRHTAVCAQRCVQQTQCTLPWWPEPVNVPMRQPGTRRLGEAKPLVCLIQEGQQQQDDKGAGRLGLSGGRLFTQKQKLGSREFHDIKFEEPKMGKFFLSLHLLTLRSCPLPSHSSVPSPSAFKRQDQDCRGQSCGSITQSRAGTEQGLGNTCGINKCSLKGWPRTPQPPKSTPSGVSAVRSSAISSAAGSQSSGEQGQRPHPRPDGAARELRSASVRCVICHLLSPSPARALPYHLLKYRTALW